MELLPFEDISVITITKIILPDVHKVLNLLFKDCQLEEYEIKMIKDRVVLHLEDGRP